MNIPELRSTVAVPILVAALAVSAAPLAAHRPAPHPDAGPAIRLPVASGWLEVSLRPDGGGPLPLAAAGPNRWVLAGPTTALVGESYSLVLANRTGERLKVVVGVDGLNVYEREVIGGRADQDVGSILAPWGERTLPGWQLGHDRAQRFVFSPREWSEGQGRTDAQIGLVTVQVYREWSERGWDDRDRGEREPSLRRAPAEGAEEGASRGHGSPPSAQAPSRSPRAQSMPAPDAAIGTASGDDVASRVRTVHFVAATSYPEVWAVIDYGRAARVPWEPPGVELLGLRIDGDRDGTRIVAVAPGSPAAEAGLRPWDVIVRLDTVTRPSPATTRRILETKRRGDFAFFRVRRGGHELALKIRG
jgi:hypothetical protein